MTTQDNGVDLRNLTDDQVMRQLALQWKNRRENLGLKSHTAKHADQQLSFFIGAMSAMQLCGRKAPISALLVLSVNRDAVELWAKDEEKRS